MIYTFSSQAAGKLVMLEPAGNQILRLIGKERAPRGIIDPAAMPAAIRALESAILLEQETEPHKTEADAAAAEGPVRLRSDGVSLQQQVLPLMDMMKRAHRDNAPIVWGS